MNSKFRKFINNQPSSIVSVPELIQFAPIHCIGLCITNNLAQNKTAELWYNFQLLRKKKPETAETPLISLRDYPKNYFDAFSPECTFIQWALMEKRNKSGDTPEGFTSFFHPGGTYVSFEYNGPPNNTSAFRWIFEDWLPASEFTLDHRLHFEWLYPDYSKLKENNREKIFIPVCATENQTKQWQANKDQES